MCRLGQCSRMVPLLLGLTVLLAFGTAGCGEGVHEQAPLISSLPITATSSGFTITLSDVEIASDQTALTMMVSDADPNAEPEISTYDPPLPPDFQLDGLAWKSDSLGTVRTVYDDTSQADQKPITGTELTLLFKPIQTASDPVTLTLSRLRFRSTIPDQLSMVVDGMWTFSFRPAEIGPSLGEHITNAKGVTADGVTFSVDDIWLHPARTVIRYHLRTSREGAYEATGLVARLQDDSIVLPNKIEREDDVYIATFQPFPAGSPVTLSLSSILTEVPHPLQFTIPVDGHQISAQSVAHHQPLNVQFHVDGEPLVVEGVDIQEGQFAIRITNTTDGHRGTVLLRYPSKEGVALIDNTGRSYPFVGASTNLAKSDPLNMWADGSSFMFEGSIGPDVSALTLHVDSYARQLRGPWNIVVTTPSP